jgi:small nuclear ribonucleoprotein (snRNP)-like protein
VWLFDQPTVRLEGVIAGFDEYMNLVLEGAEEVSRGRGGGAERRSALGRLLLKGDNITAITGVPVGVGGGGGGGGGGGDSSAAAGGGGGGGGGGGEGGEAMG